MARSQGRKKKPRVLNTLVYVENSYYCATLYRVLFGCRTVRSVEDRYAIGHVLGYRLGYRLGGRL